MKKKVLHLLSTNRLSGAENVVADICMMFGDEFDMVYCSPDGSIRESLSERNINFIPLSKFNYFEFRRAINFFKPDIIHAHDIRATFLACISSIDIPIFSHLHGNHVSMRKFSLRSLLFLILSIKLKYIIVVSKTCIDDFYFKNYIKNKTFVLSNIVHFNRIKMLIDKDSNSYNFDFVFLGRLTYAKNPERVAQVASEVLKLCPNSTFGVIGDGEMKDQMVKVFKDNGVLHKVIFTGNLKYPYKALKGAKCLLMCSRYEGLPISALEAMALGVPIVSTPVDGFKNIVVNNVTGYLSDDNYILSSILFKIINNNEFHNFLSNNTVIRFNKINNEKYYKISLKRMYE